MTRLEWKRGVYTIVEFQTTGICFKKRTGTSTTCDCLKSSQGFSPENRVLEISQATHLLSCMFYGTRIDDPRSTPESLDWITADPVWDGVQNVSTEFAPRRRGPIVLRVWTCFLDQREDFFCSDGIYGLSYRRSNLRTCWMERQLWHVFRATVKMLHVDLCYKNFH